MPVHFPYILDGVYVRLLLQDKITLMACRYVALIQVAIAQGFHLFPFRTEKLSLVTPMVLRNSGRVGSRRFFREFVSSLEETNSLSFLYPSRELSLLSYSARKSLSLSSITLSFDQRTSFIISKLNGRMILMILLSKCKLYY